MKKVLIPLFICLLALVLIGCSSQSTSTSTSTSSTTTTQVKTSTATQSSTSAATPQRGGVLKMIFGMGPVAFGYPAASSPLDSPGSLGILEGLVGVDGNGDPTPLLATSWNVSEDGKTVTFNLRKGVKFHDGTDFNADAVKWNIDLELGAKLITAVTSVDVIDNYTVKFNLPQYNSVVFTQLSDGFYISPTAVQKNGVDWAKTNAVGTGPFMQKDFKRDASITKVRFPDYWDTGKPYLDGLEEVFIPDTTAAKISFEAGEAQILMALGDPKSGRDLANKGYVVRAFDGLSQFIIADSANQDSPFSKLKVRQAMAYAIDRKSIADTVGAGYWKVTNQICPKGFVGNNPNLPDIPYDSAKAKQLLSEAGYPNGFTTKLMAIGAFYNNDLITAVQSNLKDAGIDATVDIMDMGRGFATMQAGWNNGIMIGGTGLDPNMLQRMAIDLGKGNYPTTARSTNWYSLLEQASAARDTQGRGKYLQDLMKETIDEMMVVPLMAATDIAAMTKAVNSDLLLYHHIKWHPADAWLSK
jgi:peptide/nickel transport system substrate-binding protein